MKNKSVHSHRLIKLFMTTLVKLFKIEFERGTWKRAKISNATNRDIITKVPPNKKTSIMNTFICDLGKKKRRFLIIH